jgi:hypothetical protein
MANQKIILELFPDNLWHWSLHEPNGSVHVCERGEPAADLAALQAHIRHNHLSLMKGREKRRAIRLAAAGDIVQ